MMKFTKADTASGLDPSSLAEAPELVRSVARAMEGLAEEIQSLDQGHWKWVPRWIKVVATELELLKTNMLQIWFISAVADPRHGAPAQQARDATYSIEGHWKWVPRWIKVVATELELLKTNMLQIWFISAVADPRHGAPAQQARDATYSIEVIQDKIECCRLQSSLVPRNKILNHLFKLLLALRCRWNRSNPDRIIREIKAMNEKAHRLVPLLDKGQGQFSNPPPSSPGSVSNTRRTVVYGRDRERDEVVRMLIRSCGEAAPEMMVSLVGDGGIGKTTLAQMVFNDESVRQHFDVRCWVSVSSVSNQMELATEILRSAQPSWVGSDENKMVGFQVLRSELRQFVASKRCLIVLDDVCNSKDETLLDIVTPLLSADSRSRILVTSRMIPHILGSSQLYTVNPLDTDDCWSLLKEHAFPIDDENVHPDLKLIGKEIATKTNGSPLAAKLVGGLLGETRSKAHWRNILETGLQDGTVFSALLLSYKNLPGHLKRCFTYCSLFPEDYKFDPAHLSRLWIAEGFVHPHGRAEKRMEDIAREYFDQLLSCSFFQEINIGHKTYYLVHGLLHELAKYVAEEDCFRIDDGMNFDIPSTVRHLSVTMNNLPGLINFSGLEKLRTLLIQPSLSSSSSCFQEDFVVNLKGILAKSKHLHVLDLSCYNSKEFPNCINDLLHLRYLSIHGSIQRLPESIGRLCHLQTLRFTGECSLEKLPASIIMLVNLRHLIVETKYTAGLVGIGRLANLQGSLELHIERREGHKLEELRNINGLRGLLKIKGLENVSSYEEACKAELNKKTHLNSLNLEWSFASRNNPPSADAEVLEGLKPHQDIKVLHIRRSLGILPPLGNLGSLRYLHMKELCAVDRIGHEFYGNVDVAFPSLSVLELDDFPKLRQWAGTEDKVSFPCLERLIIVDCPELVGIPPFSATTREVTIERTCFMPYMRLAPFSSGSEKLQLDVCTTSGHFNGLLHKQHLKVVVALNITGAEQVVATEEIGSLVSLQRLQLRRCNFTDYNFSRFLQALPCLSSLEIIDLPNLTSLPALEIVGVSTMLTDLSVRNCQFLQSLSSLQFFDSLKYLVIERCPKVTATSFPLNFRSLSSLRVLRISHCSELQSLPTCGLPSSLETLHITRCHPELSKQSRNMKGH
ncbi:unnamed protein product [Triticum turgidum subsp. durum]|uniref:NB-ARC domain-containing protein n=1 Tax=Triticum turgidum subsp. durum TaxID=4567 RepID=A0A9R1PBN6_TRITD|nr:unnamed protein product [Triticum turgidum subsp. durum]